MTNLYYLLILILLIGIGYYSLKYLFFVFIGMILAFYISYKYLFPLFCSMNKITI
jgi:hypothetical protein